MIGAYMDESFDGPTKPGAFVVGGLMGRGVAVFELERRWEALRKRRDIDIAYFKAVECERGTGEFAKFVSDPKNKTPEELQKLKSIHDEFIALIVNPVKYDDNSYFTVFGIAIVQQDFHKLINSDAKAREILGKDPYRLAYSFAMIHCAWAMKQLATGDLVSFVCDEHEQYSSLAAAEYPFIKSQNPEASQYMATFFFQDEKTCEPLQAADLIVYELRRAINTQLSHWSHEFRRTFNVLRDNKMVFSIQHASEVNLRLVVEANEPGKPFLMDELMSVRFGEDIDFGH